MLKDVDAGIVWQGYNPAVLDTSKLKANNKPFFFGGSQIPFELGIKGNTPVPLVSKSKVKTRVIKKLPKL